MCGKLYRGCTIVPPQIIKHLSHLYLHCLSLIEYGQKLTYDLTFKMMIRASDKVSILISKRVIAKQEAEEKRLEAQN